MCEREKERERKSGKQHNGRKELIIHVLIGTRIAAERDGSGY